MSLHFEGPDVGLKPLRQPETEPLYEDSLGLVGLDNAAKAYLPPSLLKREDDIDALDPPHLFHDRPGARAE